MLGSLRRSLGKALKAPSRILIGTGDFRDALRIAKLQIAKKIYTRPVSVAEMRGFLRDLGIEKGRNIWVQSSWNEFYNFPLKPTETVALVRDIMGPEGTLAMPAFTVGHKTGAIWDARRVPSASGLLTEVLRRTPGTRRSIHLTSSVVALGPQADFLVRDHHHVPLTWGQDTPFVRLGEIEARCVCLGLGNFVSNLTVLHAVECLLRDDVDFFEGILRVPVTYTWKDGERSGEHTFFRRDGVIETRGYGRHFDRTLYVQKRISNLDGYAIDARAAIARGMELARRGITIYPAFADQKSKQFTR